MSPHADWIGRTRKTTAVLEASDLARLAALLNREAPAEVPPAWHWACLAEPVARADIGPDGHPRRGLFLPPIAATRRMFASADMSFSGALVAGQETDLVETIANIEEKPGASGPLTFVTVDRVISQANELRVRERQTIVYTSASSAPRVADSGPPRPPPGARTRPPTPFCCSPSRPRPRTATASTTTLAMRRRSRGIQASSCMAR